MQYSNNLRNCSVWAVLLLSFSFSGEDALSLLQRNRFIQAIEAWEHEAKAIKVSQAKLRAIKGQALAYHKLGVLYGLYHRTFTELVDEYYSKIGNHYPSPTLQLYQGQAAFYRSSYTKSLALMEKVINNRQSSSLERDMAKVYRHYAVNHIHKKRGRLILKSRHPEVLWQLTQLDSRAALPKNLKSNSPRSLGNKLLILLRQKNLNERLIYDALKNLMEIGDDPEMVLNRGELTQVNFYNPQLYLILSKSFFTMSNIRYQFLIKTDKKYPELAKKFKTDFSLAENYFHLGKYELASKYIKHPKSSQELLLVARIKAGEGKKKAAKNILDNIPLNKRATSITREVGYAYFDLDLHKVKGLQLTAKATRQKATSPYFRRYGLILLGLGKYQEALEVFAKGYKIQYRNSVDHINPEYMIDYAYTIFKASKMRYEEVVETLYHLQKAYPACRPLHYCMQGIAAAQTRAFGTQKIFKKGG